MMKTLFHLILAGLMICGVFTHSNAQNTKSTAGQKVQLQDLKAPSPHSNDINYNSKGEYGKPDPKPAAPPSQTENAKRIWKENGEIKPITKSPFRDEKLDGKFKNEDNTIGVKATIRK